MNTENENNIVEIEINDINNDNINTSNSHDNDTNSHDTTDEYIIKELMQDEEFKKLRPQHRALMPLFLQGYKSSEIAEFVGLHRNTVYNVWNNPTFQKVYNKLDALRHEKVTSNIAKVRDILDKSSVEAATYLTQLVEDEMVPVSIRHRSAKDILEMAGHKATNRVELDDKRDHEVIEIRDPNYSIEDDPYYQQQKELGNVEIVDEDLDWDDFEE
jgi:hypothetical protein